MFVYLKTSKQYTYSSTMGPARRPGRTILRTGRRLGSLNQVLSEHKEQNNGTGTTHFDQYQITTEGNIHSRLNIIPSAITLLLK